MNPSNTLINDLIASYKPLVGVSHPLIEGVLVVIIISLAIALNKSLGRKYASKQKAGKKIQSLSDRQHELEAVLTSMVEGVIAVDQYLNIINLNRAAALLLQIESTQAVGKPLCDIIHQDRLNKLASETLWGKGPLQADIALPNLNKIKSDDEDDPVRMFQAQGALLRDMDGNRIGALIVLHDVTRLRKLELIRRDFVSNSSHEFKTPVAAIRGSAETLQDDPAADAETRERFLGIIVRQSQRLQAIVEDMLSLARIEEGAEDDSLAFESLSVEKVLKEASLACEQRSNLKNTHIDIMCEPSIMANLNRTLVEQAVVNLIDNAIKYSPKNSRITVEATVNRDETTLGVTDNGPGIAEEHLPRLFERFYRTDKARSRAVGGTGLGLAIVKHVAAAHGGRVSVSSVVGIGSTFYIHLPNG